MNTRNVSGKPKTSTGPRFSGVLEELFGAGRKLQGLEKEINNLDQLIDEKRRLEAQLESRAEELRVKETEIAKLRSDKDRDIEAKNEEIAKIFANKETLFREFQERYKAWDTGSTKRGELEAKIKTLEGELSKVKRQADSLEEDLIISRRESASLQNTLGDTQSKAKKIEKKLGSKERELAGTVRALEQCHLELDEERKELELQHLDLQYLAPKFNAFTNRCHDLAKRFFLAELPQELIPEIRKQLQQSSFNKAVSGNIPIFSGNIPISNSAQSRYLRMAAAETIIANKLYVNIFQQYYLPDYPPARAAMDDALEKLSGGSPRGEAIFRLRLLSAYKQGEAHKVAELVASTSDQIASPLSPLLISPNDLERFRAELDKLLKEAVQLWKPIQRNVVKGVVDNIPNEDWGEYEEHDSAIKLTSDQEAHIPNEPVPIMSLFPSVSIGNVVVCPGYALWSNQKSVVAGAIECSISRNSTHRRTGSSTSGGKDRQGNGSQKISLNGSSTAGGRTGAPPTSPRSVSTNQSFTSHALSRSMAVPRTLPGDDEKASRGNP